MVVGKGSEAETVTKWHDSGPSSRENDAKRSIFVHGMGFKKQNAKQEATCSIDSCHIFFFLRSELFFTIKMNNEIQYGSDSDDSVASDNEGIVFAESNRKKADTAKQGNGQTQKTRAKATPKHDLDAPEGEQGVQKPKKRRRTVEVSELPFHDEEEYADGTIPQGRFRSRIWNEAMVSKF